MLEKINNYHKLRQQLIDKISDYDVTLENEYLPFSIIKLPIEIIIKFSEVKI